MCMYIYIYIYVFIERYIRLSINIIISVLGCGQMGSTLMGPLQK